MEKLVLMFTLFGVTTSQDNTADCNLDCNNGICVMGADSITICNCEEGYAQPACTGCLPGYIQVGNICDLDNCLAPEADCANGVCVDEINNFTCNCNTGFAAPDCLACAPGYTGPSCDTISDYCQALAVDCNSGMCFNAMNNFTCECDPGYTGQFCDTIDNCQAPEMNCNFGTCINAVDSLDRCQCDPGYALPNCIECMNGYEGNRCDQQRYHCRWRNPCRPLAKDHQYLYGHFQDNMYVKCTPAPRFRCLTRFCPHGKFWDFDRRRCV